MEYCKTKKDAERLIKKLDRPGVFSPTWIYPHWYIMSNVTGKIIQPDPVDTFLANRKRATSII